MLEKQATDLFRVVTSHFRNPSGNVGVHVWTSIKSLFHPVEILRVIGEMDADKRRPGMAFNNAIQRFQQFHPWRVTCRVTKPPTLVILQFGPAFVLVVIGKPERSRVTDMD